MKKLLNAIWELLYGSIREPNGVAQYFRPARWFEVNSRFVDGVIGVIETAHLGRWLVKTEGWIPSQHNPHSVYQVFGWPLDQQGREWASRHGLFYSCYPGIAARYSESDSFVIDYRPDQAMLDKREIWPLPGRRAKLAEQQALDDLKALVSVDLELHAIVESKPFWADETPIAMADPFPLFVRPSLVTRTWRRFKRKVWKSPALALFGTNYLPLCKDRKILLH